MTNDTKLIHNAETNEIEILTLNDVEQSQLDAERLLAIKAQNDAKEKAEQTKSLKISAYQKLGLTPEEIEILTADA
jgi:hypothetical protein